MQSLDRIKCRLLEGINAQEVRAMVLDMQARLLLDMLGKGIESALMKPSALVPEPWQATGETLSGIDPEEMAVDPALVFSIQVSFFLFFSFFCIFFYFSVLPDDILVLFTCLICILLTYKYGTLNGCLQF